jgi:putative transposase
VRHSLDFISRKARKAVVRELRATYGAQDTKAGLAAQEAFEVGPWGTKYPAVAPAWRRNWDRVIPFFAFPEAVRRIVYTTNDIEALNSRAATRRPGTGDFPNDEAAT